MGKKTNILKSTEKYIKKHGVSKTPEQMFIEFQAVFNLHKEFETYIMNKKNTNTQTQSFHPLNGFYPSNSLYNWQSFSRKKLAVRCKIILGMLEDCITIQDMFEAINTFVNYANPKKDNFFTPEANLNGLNQLFVVGMIEDDADKDRLLDLMHNAINQSRSTSKSVKERAEMVENLLRWEVLNCICLN